MNRHKQAPIDFFVGVDWGNAFRAQVVRAIPAMPVVISPRLDCASEIRTPHCPHWLSGFIVVDRTATVAKLGMPSFDC